MKSIFFRLGPLIWNAFAHLPKTFCPDMVSVDKYLHRKTKTDSVFEQDKYPTASLGGGTNQPAPSRKSEFGSCSVSLRAALRSFLGVVSSRVHLLGPRASLSKCTFLTNIRPIFLGTFNVAFYISKHTALISEMDRTYGKPQKWPRADWRFVACCVLCLLKQLT